MSINFKTAISIGLATILGGAILQAQAADKHTPRGKSISVLKGKCGAGKCGSSRIRQMMDRNADGMINRNEYVGWTSAQAAKDFNRMAKGAVTASADVVFETLWDSDGGE